MVLQIEIRKCVIDFYSGSLSQYFLKPPFTAITAEIFCGDPLKGLSQLAHWHYAIVCSLKI